jgi:hypothetical protein
MKEGRWGGGGGVEGGRKKAELSRKAEGLSTDVMRAVLMMEDGPFGENDFFCSPTT